LLVYKSTTGETSTSTRAYWSKGLNIKVDCKYLNDDNDDEGYSKL
jgi:hypothetical protein